MWTRESVKRSYGVDLQDLETRHPETLCGLVTPSGVIWRSAGSPALPCREDCLVEILRARGQQQCLFLSMGAARDSRIDELLSSVPSTVEYLKIQSGDRQCRLLFHPEAAEVS